MAFIAAARWGGAKRRRRHSLIPYTMDEGWRSQTLRLLNTVTSQSSRWPIESSNETPGRYRREEGAIVLVCQLDLPTAHVTPTD